MSNIKSFVHDMEAKYHRMMSRVEAEKADAEYEARKARLEAALEDLKMKGEEKYEDAKESVQDAWDAFESKVKSIAK